jgi:hypothetical protein
MIAEAVVRIPARPGGKIVKKCEPDLHALGSLAMRLALAALLLIGCAVPPRRVNGPRRASRSAAHHVARPGPRGVPSVALVERALHARGFRFGTDGTIGALHGYLVDNGRPVSPEKARPGDVVFFDLGGGGCQDHVGLAENVDPDGRITFREARDGQVRTSYARAGEPCARRDDQGRILNTFLRPKRPDDPPETRYFAGELLCAVLRLE